MPRYIDADAFERAVMFSDDEDLQDVIYRLRDYPTIDAVEVVRCKDCMFGHRYFDTQNGVTDCWVECQNPDGLDRDVSEDGYCSASIRRKG